MKKSWKTTVFGIAAAVGIAMQTSSNPTVKFAGLIIAAVGTGGSGVFSKDHNVSGK